MKWTIIILVFLGLLAAFFTSDDGVDIRRHQAGKNFQRKAA
jgi:hypothetical protein